MGNKLLAEDSDTAARSEGHDEAHCPLRISLGRCGFDLQQ
jgi:hypothetical protein